LVSSKFRKVDGRGIDPVHTNYWYYEFGCQGLELDLPLVSWGPDLTWSGAGWMVRTGRSRHVLDPVRLRKNTYRVLLTRGRDGVCIFVPREPTGEMDLTYSAIIQYYQAGVAQFPG